MTDHPIIYSAPMVRALLENRKTMTRRVVKLPTKGEYVRPDMGGWAPTTVGGGKSFTLRRDGTRVPAPELVAIWNRTTGTCVAARYQIGDRLWVRESLTRSGGYIQYVADGSTKGCRIWPATWKQDPRPSIHMPREVSRLTLIVTAVKIERLQDISEADSIAEGSQTPLAELPSTARKAAWSERQAFAHIWDSIHGAGAWDINPFVVAPTFRVIRANIDAPEAAAA